MRPNVSYASGNTLTVVTGSLTKFAHTTASSPYSSLARDVGSGPGRGVCRPPAESSPVLRLLVRLFEMRSYYNAEANAKLCFNPRAYVEGFPNPAVAENHGVHVVVEAYDAD